MYVLFEQKHTLAGIKMTINGKKITLIAKNIEFNVNDILKIFYQYIQTNFDAFNHNVPIGEKFESWWHRHSFGTSYQPIVQMCYILKGQELGFDVREHHSQIRISELAREIHGIKYNKQIE